jgi:hypothetical protein
MRGFVVLSIAILLAFSVAVEGDALVVNTVDGTIYDTQGLTDFQTLGDDMVGMTVIATFSDGSVDSKEWVAGDPGAGGVGSDSDIWSLNVTGDTFDVGDNRNWTLTVSASVSLTNLFIDAGTGDTVFDIERDNSLSPESFLGKPFFTSYADYLIATYSDLVGIEGTVYDDLYRTLNLDFGSGLIGTELSFTADTDNLAIKGDINPVDPANPIPEPTTLLLLGTGLMGIAGVGRKKFFKS